MISKLGLLTCSALIGASSFAFAAQASEHLTSSAAVRQKLSDIVTQVGAIDAETRYMNAAQIACGQFNSGNPGVDDDAVYNDFMASHADLMQRAMTLIQNTTSGTDIKDEFKDDYVKTLSANLNSDIEKTLKAFDGSTNLCSELAGRQIIANTVLGGIVNGETNLKVSSLAKAKEENRDLTKKLETLGQSCNLESAFSLDSLAKILDVKAKKAYGQATVVSVQVFSKDILAPIVQANIDLSGGKDIKNCDDAKAAIDRAISIGIDIDHAIRQDIAFFGFDGK